MSALAITAGAVVPYLVASLPALAKDGVGLAHNFVNRPLGIRAALHVHVTFAGLALVLSTVQLVTRVRAKLPRLHRAVGRTALVAIVVGGVAGVEISTVSMAGIVGTAGFGLLGVLWVAFALNGFRAIRRGAVFAHRQWMVRASSLTYAGARCGCGCHSSYLPSPDWASTTRPPGTGHTPSCRSSVGFLTCCSPNGGSESIPGSASEDKTIPSPRSLFAEETFMTAPHDQSGLAPGELVGPAGRSGRVVSGEGPSHLRRHEEALALRLSTSPEDSKVR